MDHLKELTEKEILLASNFENQDQELFGISSYNMLENEKFLVITLLLRQNQMLKPYYQGRNI